MNIGTLPRRYLGMPLLFGGNLGDFWEHILGKVKKKLESWKEKWLSAGGWLVKIKSILSAIPIFWMGAFWVPKTTINSLEKLMRDFL